MSEKSATRLKPVKDPNVKAAIREMRERAERRVQARQKLRLSGKTTPSSTLHITKSKVF